MKNLILMLSYEDIDNILNSDSFYKPTAVYKYSKKQGIVVFRFAESLNDIRVRFLAFYSLLDYYKLSKSYVKQFNVNTDSILNFKKDTLFTSSEEIKLVDFVELVQLTKDLKGIKRFAEVVGVNIINNQLAVYDYDIREKLEDDTLLDTDNVYSTMSDLTLLGKENYILISFKEAEVEFNRVNATGKATKVKVDNLKIEDIKNTSRGASYKISDLKNTCELLKDFIDGKILNYSDYTLKMILSNIVGITGGWEIFKNALINNPYTSSKLEYYEKYRTIYRNKGTCYKCNMENCGKYFECTRQRIFNTTELVNRTWERKQPIPFLEFEEAVKKNEALFKEVMSNLETEKIDINNGAVGLGKTYLYCKWICDTLDREKEIKDLDNEIKALEYDIATAEINGEETLFLEEKMEELLEQFDSLKPLQKIDVIAVPTIKLALEVKDKIQAMLGDRHPYFNIYAVRNLEEILLQLNPKLLNKYKYLNQLGAFKQAKKELIHLQEELKSKNYRDLSVLEKEYLDYMDYKERMESMNNDNAVYIITHASLSFKKESTKFKDKVIVIDEDIFETLNSIQALSCNELIKLYSQCMNAEDHEGKEQGLDILRNMISFFDGMVRTENGITSLINRKTTILGLTDVGHAKKKNGIDFISEVIFNNYKDYKTNILGFFSSEYFVKVKGTNSDYIQYNIRRYLPKAKKYILTSATAEFDIYTDLFKSDTNLNEYKIETHDLGVVKHSGSVLQLVDLPVSRNAMKTSAKDISNQVKALCGDIKTITYKSFKNDFNIDADFDYTLGNTAGREVGTKGEDIAIVGAYRQPMFVYLLHGATLGYFLSEEDELKYRIVENEYYRYKLFAFENEKITNLMEWLMVREIIQAAGRNRNIRPENKDATTYIFSPIPLAFATIVRDIKFKEIKKANQCVLANS